MNKFTNAYLNKKYIIPIILFILLIISLSSSVYYISPGHIGILVYKIPPDTHNAKGILESPLRPGYGFINPITEYAVEYPTYMQTIILCKSSVEGSPENEEININSIEGQPVSCDVSLSFELDPDKVPDLYITFRKPINEITHGFVKQTIRQVMQEVVGKVKIENFLGKEKSSVIISVEKILQERLKEYGIIIKQFTINEMRASQLIISAIEQKNVAIQEALKAQNKLQLKQFEAQQKLAEAEGEAKAMIIKAKAQASSNTLLEYSITQTLIKYKTIKKWNGTLPKICNDSKSFIDKGEGRSPPKN